MLNDNRFDLAATRVARLATLANGIVAANPLSIAPVSPTLTMGLLQNARLSSLVRGISMANRINSTPSISAIITNPPRITELDWLIKTAAATDRLRIAPSIPALIANPRRITQLNSLVSMTIQTNHFSIAPVIPTLDTRLPQTSLLNSLTRTISAASRLYDISINPILTRHIERFTQGLQFQNSGWFPHHTFPTHLLADNDDDTVTDEIILSYYHDNWSRVRQEIEEDLSTYLINDDSKEALRQALIAHENGLYLLVCPGLFAEVERAVRVCLYGNRVGGISVVSQLEDNLNRLPISALPDRSLGFVGFNQLTNHLYESIRTDADRKLFSDSAVPNRHAAIHGLLTYSSEKNSLNAIFIAVYVFQLLTAIKTSQKSFADSPNAIVP